MNFFHTGVPHAKEFSAQELCTLYILMERKLQYRAPKLTGDEKKLAKQLTIYKHDVFADNFGDGGHLAHMNEYEDDKGELMADFIDTKYGTSLSLNWTSTDTEQHSTLVKTFVASIDETKGGDEAKDS